MASYRFLIKGMPIILGLALLSACAPARNVSETRGAPAVFPTPTARVISAASPPAPTLTPIPPPTIAVPTLTPSPQATQTPSPSATPSASPIPTYVRLRGEVTIDQAFCHYGPGAPYLYKYGVYKGSNLEILRRMAGGNYLEVQAIGGKNPCWVKVDYMKIKGDLSSLQPAQIEEISLPISPYYASPGGVAAKRSGIQVSITWHALDLRAGDDSEQTPYIIEAVVCQKGEMVFVPAGTYKNGLTVEDEAGCSAPSHAWFVAAEKHGYTPRVAVPWPPAGATPGP